MAFCGAMTTPRGMPSASTAVERLMPRFPRSTGDPLVGTTEHQDLDQLREDHLIGYARPVAAERVVGFSWGLRARERRRLTARV